MKITIFNLLNGEHQEFSGSHEHILKQMASSAWWDHLFPVDSVFQLVNKINRLQYFEAKLDNELTKAEGSKDFKQEAPVVNGNIKLHNYDHLLTPNHISQGYSLSVADVDDSGKKSAIASIFHNGKKVGQTLANVDIESGKIKSTTTDLHKDHQQKGLAKLLHQAVWSHGHEKYNLVVDLDDHIGMTSGSHRAKVSAAKELNLPYTAKAILPAELVKNATMPKFPKLGVTDDRRETPIINDPMSLHVKTRLMSNTLARQKNPEPSTEDIISAGKKNFGNIPSVKHKLHGAATRVPKTQGLSPASFSIGSELRDGSNKPQKIDDKRDIATKVHEDAHLMMARVFDNIKLPMQHQNNFSQNLWNLARQRSKPAAIKGTELKQNTSDIAHNLFHSVFENHITKKTDRKEEKITQLLSYLNDPAKRFHFNQQLVKEMRRTLPPNQVNPQSIEVMKQAANGIAKNMFRNIQKVAAEISPQDVEHFSKHPDTFSGDSAFWQQNADRFLKTELGGLDGGLADGMDTDDFNQKDLTEATEHESAEHTPNKKIAQKIAADHLSEDPDYYKKLPT